MESAATAECHQTAAKMSPERAIAVKCMYITLIKELHDLKTAGPITGAEYNLQKDIILVLQRCDRRSRFTSCFTYQTT